MQFLIAMPYTIGAAAAALITDIKAAQNVYAKSAGDIISASVGLEGANNIFKASKSPSRVLFKEVANTVCTALLLAAAFGLDGNAVKNTVTISCNKIQLQTMMSPWRTINSILMASLPPLKNCSQTVAAAATVIAS